jgi:hypothetical protein
MYNGYTQTVVVQSLHFIQWWNTFLVELYRGDIWFDSGTFKSWKLSTAQAGAMWLEGCYIIHFPSCTDSVKPSLQCSCNSVVIKTSEDYPFSRFVLFILQMKIFDLLYFRSCHFSKLQMCIVDTEISERFEVYFWAKWSDQNIIIWMELPNI